MEKACLKYSCGLKVRDSCRDPSMKRGERKQFSRGIGAVAEIF